MVMSDQNYKTYEANCERERRRNTVLINAFREWLQSDRLSQKVVDRHCGNVDFFINTYLLKYDIIPASQGATAVSGFLGDWFIHKALWANKSSIRDNAASLKKFYKYMVERAETTEADLEILTEDIKEEMGEWLEELKRFDSLADADM